ncbi:MAG: BMP family ABC transporter substrate-binding protein [Clostridiales bacterium]|nr:BMP family ABC transporter substrate-binding protein [Clostridiales bacterium]
MKKIWIVAVAVILVIALAACGGNKGSAPSAPAPGPGGSPGNSAPAGGGGGPSTTQPLVVGFIYIGTINDGGYTQSQHQATMALQKALGDKVKCIWLENIDDTNSQAAQDAAKQLIDQGATVVIGTSFGFGDGLFQMAQSGNYNNIKFLHFSGSNINDTNFGNYFGAMEEPRYLSGIIAGMQTKSNKIGYVAAYPNTEVQIGINALALGAQSVNPNATVSVVYINSWYDPAQEKAAAEALLSQGCDVIAQHSDTPGPMLAAAAAGKLGIGYDLDNSQLDGLQDSYLTAPIWHQETYLIPAVTAMINGTWKPESYYGNMADGMVALAPLTKNVTPEAKAKVEQVEAQIKAGNFPIFKGPIYDNQGNEVVKDGQTLDRAAIWTTNYLVKGVTAAQ